jgi:hypothetical protein
MGDRILPNFIFFAFAFGLSEAYGLGGAGPALAYQKVEILMHTYHDTDVTESLYSRQ